MRTPNTLALTLALAAAAACGSDGVTPPEQSGTSRVLLTDSPFPYHRLSRVDMYIVSVSASLSADTSPGSGGFVTLVSPHRRINLLALQNGITDELGRITLPTGAITAVRMVIDTDSSSITLRDGRVLTGSSTPGISWQSSAGRPVLNALIHEQIAVPDTGAIVVIDYDVGSAFIPPQEIDPSSTDSGFIFSPVLHAADATRTGAIAGVVRAGSASGPPVKDAALRLYLGYPGTPENTWPGFGNATTDANGSFRFSYVTRSTWWESTAWGGATYIVAVDPPPGSGLGRVLVPNLTVTAGGVTNAGTVVLP